LKGIRLAVDEEIDPQSLGSPSIVGAGSEILAPRKIFQYQSPTERRELPTFHHPLPEITRSGDVAELWGWRVYDPHLILIQNRDPCPPFPGGNENSLSHQIHDDDADDRHHHGRANDYENGRTNSHKNAYIHARLKAEN
jgi:hypothetical protein